MTRRTSASRNISGVTSDAYTRKPHGADLRQARRAWTRGGSRLAWRKAYHPMAVPLRVRKSSHRPGAQPQIGWHQILRLPAERGQHTRTPANSTSIDTPHG